MNEQLPARLRQLRSRHGRRVSIMCCTSLPASRTENIEVHSSRHSLETLYVITDRLAQPEGRWQPMQPSADEEPP